MEISRFNQIIDKYKIIFFDSFGVLKNYNGVIEGAVKSFDLLKEKNIEYFVITNDASRSSGSLLNNLHDLGYTQISKSQIVSSGRLTMDYLDNKIGNGKVVYLGTKATEKYLKDNGYTPISIVDINLETSEIEDFDALVFFDEEEYDWNLALNNCVNLLRKKNIPTVVANNDFIYPKSKRNMSIAIGALAHIVEKIVKKEFIYFGKPDAQMFNEAFTKVQQLGNFEKKDILMVGDTLTTDIIGANKFGIDSALVLSGNSWIKTYESEIKSYGIIPNYVCRSIGE